MSGRSASMGIAALAAMVVAVDTRAAQQPTFHSGVNLVTVTATVRDEDGRMVRDLGQDDFVVLDAGEPRRIVDFRVADQGPVSVAFLFDRSGSMAIGSNLQSGKRLVEFMLAWMQPGADRVALYAFGDDLVELQALTSDPAAVRASMGRLDAWGKTAIYDAIAATARRVESGGVRRRAIVVVTDGIDTASRLSPSDVSGMASAINVPVYIFVVMLPVDHPDIGSGLETPDGQPVATNLENLARWTGGDTMLVTSAEQASRAVRQLIVELRHQYLLAFEALPGSGWRALEVRTRDDDLTVRARSGYFANQPPSAQ